MEENRVSVLVTFYNQEKYVDRALKSILDQKTDFGFKVLVGDDGSTDDTCKLVREWINKYPDQIELYVMNREPGQQIPGFRASRNRLNLLSYVVTEYFAFLDGDDYYDYIGKLQKQVEILDDTANEDCVACGHNADKLFPDGRRIPIVSSKLLMGKYAPKKYWDKLYFHTDTMLIRSNVISTIDRELLENNYNDNMITFTLIQQGKIYYIPESWAVYCQTGDGVWTSGKTIENHIRNMFLYDLCNRINPDMRRQTTHRFASSWMNLYRLRKQIKPALLGQFSREAEKRDLKNSYRWIHYKDMSIMAKQMICAKTGYICMRKLVKKWISNE